MGVEGIIGALVGEAEQFVLTRREGVVLKRERFYRVELPYTDDGSIADRQPGSEGDVGWIDASAVPKLREEAQRWAVAMARGSAQRLDE